MSAAPTAHPQTNLDEEFARSLQIAEERQAQVQARSQRETGSSLSNSSGLSYQPRAPRGAHHQPSNPFGDDQHQVSGGSTTGYDSYGRPIQQQQQDYNYRGGAGAGAGRTGGMWGDEHGSQGQGPAGPGLEEKFGKYAEGQSHTCKI